jgi:transposase
MSLADPAADRPPTTAAHLPDDAATLKRMVLELLASLHERDRDIEGYRHRINLLLRRLYGPRGERMNPDQLLLFPEPAASQDTAPAPAEPAPATKPKRRCRPHGRRRLPENLPRQPRHHELPEAARVCQSCGQIRIDIGVDRSEQLDYRPASLFVVEHFVHKYVCPCCSRRPAHAQVQQIPPDQESEPMPERPSESQPPPLAAEATPTPGPMDTPPEQVTPTQQPTEPGHRSPAPTPLGRLLDPSEVVIAAPKPAMSIPKGLPGPGLLAHLIVSKYTDHMPLHRLERAYERQAFSCTALPCATGWRPVPSCCGRCMT